MSCFTWRCMEQCLVVSVVLLRIVSLYFFIFLPLTLSLFPVFPSCNFHQFFSSPSVFFFTFPFIFSYFLSHYNLFLSILSFSSPFIFIMSHQRHFVCLYFLTTSSTSLLPTTHTTFPPTLLFLVYTRFLSLSLSPRALFFSLFNLLLFLSFSSGLFLFNCLIFLSLFLFSNFLFFLFFNSLVIYSSTLSISPCDSFSGSHFFQLYFLSFFLLSLCLPVSLLITNLHVFFLSTPLFMLSYFSHPSLSFLSFYFFLNVVSRLLLSNFLTLISFSFPFSSIPFTFYLSFFFSFLSPSFSLCVFFFFLFDSLRLLTLSFCLSFTLISFLAISLSFQMCFRYVFVLFFFVCSVCFLSCIHLIFRSPPLPYNFFPFFSPSSMPLLPIPQSITDSHSRLLTLFHQYISLSLFN
ncbi:unnamed protein product [Acanthosepion pharaonis]|uniref:Uncharacterized protein n=1 Tax=Acanthosepion pharaonis TaxID=158019 RepID=A0A812AX59_ACAPH|nr:unnamed protein product [Sepia pharaonis]